MDSVSSMHFGLGLNPASDYLKNILNSDKLELDM